MPHASDGHAGALEPSSMDLGGRSKAKSQSSIAASAMTAKEGGSQRHRNKQNFDYVWRSGLAGGLAGCAVSNPNLLSVLEGIIAIVQA